MTKIFSILFFSSIILFVSCEKKNNTFDVKVTRQKSGYGYQILKERKIVINQPFIPAVQGEKAFKNEADAKKTALLVVKKIVKNSFPRISIHELDSMKIAY
ncbi:DUF4907 domain-containing protein [Chryseobacterium taichungense]|uniref:DUF4907 domain-containing protein n=1 Tax=Chryseobacterium taichungense TaxID=295069 RepID=UPI0028AC0A0D|nr:DUF4907 domain-containing protein [Chryseobacterium taichungense]